MNVLLLFGVFSILLLYQAVSQQHSFYSSKLNIEVCACAKCGSTAFYRWLYQVIFHKDYDSQIPVRDLDNNQLWGNLFKRRVPGKYLVQNFSSSTNSPWFKLAIIRDPVERLLSAYRSKVSCPDKEYRRDEFIEGTSYVQGILRLANMPMKYNTNISNFTSHNSETHYCFSLHSYIYALGMVHALGKTHSLNKHFKPQDEWCFFHETPQHWNTITQINETEKFSVFLQHLKNVKYEGYHYINPEHLSPPIQHDSIRNNTGNFERVKAIWQNEYKSLSNEDSEILRVITLKEYRLLAKYLS